MVDTELLENEIKTSGLKVGFISDKLGLTRQGLRKKLNNGKFSTDEALYLGEILNMTDSKKIKIFFAKNVDINRNNEGKFV